MEKGYILRVLKNASFEKMKGTIETVHQRTGKAKAAIFFDMLWCAARYGAGYYDYQIFDFAHLNGAQRKTYVTRVISKKLNEFMNDKNYMHFFDNKDEFCTLFKEYVGRGVLILPNSTKEEVREFVSQRDMIFCKLRDKECGHGAERLKVSDFESFDALYDYLQEKGFCTIEDNIVQHPALSHLYANAVNTMRIITLLDTDGVPHYLYNVQKMGLNGSIIDNNCLFTPLDPETGKMKYPAHSGDTVKGIIYTEHPNTHVHLQGYEIPFAKQAIEMCLEAATKVPQIRYVGWDVAITPTGPVIIEGNTYCAHDFWQLPPHTPDKIGALPLIKKYAPEFKY